MTKPRTAQQPATTNDDERGDDEGLESSGAYPPAYPLFRDHDPPVEFGLVDYIIVQRVIDDAAARPGADKRSRYKTWPERFDPITTDEVTIADRCGGGVYDVRGIGAKGRTVVAARIELDAPPKERVAQQAAPSGGLAPAPIAAVQQAAPGVLSFAGLDPNAQAFIAMMQANNERAEKQLEAQRLAMKEEAQRTRDDANSMSERMVRMIEATVMRTAPGPVAAPPAPIDQQLLMRLIDRMDRQREREEDRADKRARRDARESERDDGSGPTLVLEKVLEKGPELLANLPVLQTKLAELLAPALAPALEGQARAIVSKVLNSMAEESGGGSRGGE
jgi:hypothetical protein